MDSKTIVDIFLNKRYFNPNFSRHSNKRIEKYPFDLDTPFEPPPIGLNLIYTICTAPTVGFMLEVFTEIIAHKLWEESLGKVRALHIIRTERSSREPHLDYEWFVVQIADEVIISGPVGNHSDAHRKTHEKLRQLFNLLGEAYSVVVKDTDDKVCNPFEK